MSRLNPEIAKRVVLATLILAPLGLYTGKTHAQEEEPSAIISQECPRGGFGVLRVDWSGPFPYDVTAVSPAGRRSINRGQTNGDSFDLSEVNPQPVGAPVSVDFYLQLEADASEAEKRRKLFMQVFPASCP